MKLRIQAGGTLHGKCRVPGDKSISHRALMLAALAHGTSTITHFLQSEDCLATLNILRELGVDIQHDGEIVVVHGMGDTPFKTPRIPLDCGNAGTAMRLLLGLLVGQNIHGTLVGDVSLMRRPMRRVIEPIKQLGADITSSPDGTAPLTINDASRLRGFSYTLPVASAQVKSCLLLASLGATGETEIIENNPSRDHTEKMLKNFGYPITVTGKRIHMSNGHPLRATDVQVPADISSAAFFMVGASIAPHSKVMLRDVGINPTRAGIIEVLQRMGGHIELMNQREYGGEPVADIEVTSAALHGITIPEALVPATIDEFPILFIAAACAKGDTLLRGAKELRVKESDRLASMAAGLQHLGIPVTLYDDGICITGGQFTGGHVDSHGDHRIAMAFAMAGLVAQSEITIDNCANIKTSFPNFMTLAKTLGLNLQEE